MVNMKRGTWLAIALTLLMVSLVSMLLPVLTYELNGREVASFNVLDIAEQSLELTAILSTYTGQLSLDIDPWVATLLAVLAGASVVAAFAGVITVSAQRPNRWQYMMAMTGLVGTLIPSVVIYVILILSIRYFPGTFRCGVYPIVTPIAMGICVYMVTHRYRHSRAQLYAQMAAEKHWSNPGSLLQDSAYDENANGNGYRFSAQRPESFCPNCGAKLPENLAAPVRPVARKRGWMCLLLIICCIALLCAVLAWRPEDASTPTALCGTWTRYNSELQCQSYIRLESNGQVTVQALFGGLYEGTWSASEGKTGYVIRMNLTGYFAGGTSTEDVALIAQINGAYMKMDWYSIDSISLEWGQWYKRS